MDKAACSECPTKALGVAPVEAHAGRLTVAVDPQLELMAFAA
jgi:hypothetical protein